MKVAVIGTGKTGAKVLERVGRENAVGPFNSQNPVTVEALQAADVGIAFVNAEVAKQIIPVAMEAKLPIVWATTGIDWPADLDATLKEKKITWVYGNNFSLAMGLARKMLHILGKANQLIDDFDYRLHEVHHTKKIDAPSGTAVWWQKWLGANCEITSERIGDVVGIHEATLETPEESILLRHESKDRALFAKGAIFSAEKILQGNLPAGFLSFEYLTDQMLAKGENT